MANGILTLTRTGSGYLCGQIRWSAKSNGTEANSSEVTAEIQIRRTSSAYTTTGTWRGSLTVDGKTESIHYYGPVSGNWVTVHTITTTVRHNAGGSGTCYLYGKVTGPGGTTMEGTYVSGTETVTLDAIPRYAYLVSAPDFHDEENPTITYANPVGDRAVALDACISLDGSDDEVAYRSIDKSGTGYTFQLTEEERNALRAATTEGNSRQVRFYVRTQIGDSIGRSFLARTFTIKDPEPTIDPTVADTNTTATELTGNARNLIRYCSNVDITIGAAAVKQATLKSRKVTCGNQSLSADGTITGVESGVFTFTATDSRGNTTMKSVAMPIVAYVKLTCDVDCDLPNGEGNMEVRAAGNYFNASFGQKRNSLQVSYRYKPVGGTYTEWAPMEVTLADNTYTARANVTGLDYQSAYVFQTMAQDALSQACSGAKKVKATPVFDWSEADFRFHVPVAMPENGIGVTGNKAVTLTDANDGIATGWYRITGDTANGVSVVAIMGVESINESNIVQTAFAGGYSSHYMLIQQRCCHAGVWGPWEWVEPPFMTGVEYRTTARYQGKPVFAKLVEVGALPAATAKTVVYSGTAATAISLELILSDGGIISAGYGIPRTTNSKAGIFVEATNYSVRVVTEADLSALTACAVVRYIKT